MDIFAIFTLCGGLAFFLFGMHVMSSGLEKVAGGKLEKILQRMTSNPFKSLALGLGITAVIQSSSAVTVMLVGLVNSGIMKLGQAVGVIMGSNIGTTVTAWILSLTGIESENVFVRMFNPDSFSPLLALVGIALIMMAKSSRKKDVGNILIGFAVLMFGMSVMSDAVSPLKDMPEFANILTMFQNPILGVLVGAVFTAIIQSSSASVGILQALSLTGSLTYGMVIPIIMGQNIGTCITALISSIGVNKNARRVAVVHVYFNLIGTVICLSAFYLVNAFVDLAFVEEAITPAAIAVVHSLFNVLTTIILLPFSKLLEKLACLTIRDKDKKEKYSLLDERLLRSPSFALSECENVTGQMAELARDNLFNSLGLVSHFSEKRATQLMSSEEKIDMYEDKLGTYLVKLSSKELSDDDSKQISKLLHCIGDFERIGDHAVNILSVAREMHDKGIRFSEEARSELQVLTDALIDILTTTTAAFVQNDTVLAQKVEPLEQVIDGLITEAKTRHIARLQSGACTIELGFVLSDLLNNYERVSDHCSNIAVCLIQIQDSQFDTHVYLNDLKTSGQPQFVSDFEQYQKQYVLPCAVRS